MSKQEKGFTLVELLVVVGIIGVLATFTMVAVGDAQKKARDAKRISDIKQLSTLLEGEEAQDSNRALTGCIGALVAASSCTGVGAVGVGGVTAATFGIMKDPGKNTTACARGADTTVPCEYAISKAGGGAAATTGDYQICFHLESGAAGLPKGLNAIRSGGNFAREATFGDRCK